MHAFKAMPGWRQRAAAAKAYAGDDADEDDDMPMPGKGSYLFACVVGFWTWGLMTPQTIQKIAAAVIRDLERMDGPDGAKIRREIEKLADIGGPNGSHPNNMNRDLFKILGKAIIDLWNCSVPLKVAARAGAIGATFGVSQVMLLPHILFACIGNFFPTAWAKLICPSRERISEFWSNMAGNPQLEGPARVALL